MLRENEQGTALLCKILCTNDYLDYGVCYVEFTKKELQQLFVLKEKMEELKDLGVYGFELNDIILCDFLQNTVDQELQDKVEDQEYVFIDPWEDIENEEQVRIDGNRYCLSQYGLQFVGYEKYSGSELSTLSISWETLTQLLKNCDANSKRFIVEDANA